MALLVAEAGPVWYPAVGPTAHRRGPDEEPIEVCRGSECTVAVAMPATGLPGTHCGTRTRGTCVFAVGETHRTTDPTVWKPEAFKFGVTVGIPGDAGMTSGIVGDSFVNFGSRELTACIGPPSCRGAVVTLLAPTEAINEPDEAVTGVLPPLTLLAVPVTGRGGMTAGGPRACSRPPAEGVPRSCKIRSVSVRMSRWSLSMRCSTVMRPVCPRLLPSVKSAAGATCAAGVGAGAALGGDGVCVKLSAPSESSCHRIRSAESSKTTMSASPFTASAPGCGGCSGFSADAAAKKVV